MFTKTELNTISQTIKLQGVANKVAMVFGSCSRNYVGKVLRSDKEPKTEKAKAICKEIRKLLEVLNDDIHPTGINK